MRTNTVDRAVITPWTASLSMQSRFPYLWAGAVTFVSVASPYRLIFRLIDTHAIMIFAVAHTSRRSGNWRRRK